MEKKDKKLILSILIIIGAIIVTIGITYAYWIFTARQTTKNVVKTDCFEITYTDNNDINLPSAYPLSKSELKTYFEEGTPYHFSIENVCETDVKATINLETVKIEGIKALSDDYIDIALKDSEKTLLSKESYKLKSHEINDKKVIEESENAYILYNLTLKANETKEFDLYIWMDEKTPLNSATTEATWKGKITVNASYTGIRNEIATTYLENLQTTRSDELTYDDTGDTNLRFIGSDPKNYVLFNCEKDVEPSKDTCETWRIIGAMNNVTEVSEDGKNIETTGSHLKIIRDKFEKNYSWDSSTSWVNDGYGVNEWSEATIEKVLNNEYLNRSSGLNACFRDYKQATETCPDWPNVGIREEVRNMIASVKWNTGTVPASYNILLTTAKYMYEAEQSDYNGKEGCQSSGKSTCNDDVDRTTTWTGKIGLMYPSDYGYAVGGDVRETCLGKSTYLYNSDSCMAYDWLYGDSQWTMTPAPDSLRAYNVFRVYPDGYVLGSDARIGNAVRPTLYLKSDVAIVPNDAPDYGSADNPFVLSY